MSVPVTNLPIAGRRLTFSDMPITAYRTAQSQRQLSPKRPLASAEAAARTGHDLLISKHPAIGSNMRIADMRACTHSIGRRAVAEQDEPTDPLHQQVPVSRANLLEATFTPTLLEIAQLLGRGLPRRRRVVGI